MDTVHDQNIRKAGGEGKAVLNYISDEVYNDVAGNPLIDRIAIPKRVLPAEKSGLGTCGLTCGIWMIPRWNLPATPHNRHRPEG